MANGVLQGSGTDSDPYLVEDAQDFEALRSGAYAHSYVLQTADIDLGTVANFIPMPHHGMFYEGGNKEIRNLKMDYIGEWDDRVGLFIEITSGHIKNLKVVNANIKVAGVQNTGGIVGFIQYDDRNLSPPLFNCYFKGVIETHNVVHVGGIVGSFYNNYYEEFSLVLGDCEVEGAITFSGTDAFYVGGIVGASSAIFNGCSFRGLINGTTDRGLQGAGGICGYNGLDAEFVACTVEINAKLSEEGRSIRGIPFGGLCGASSGAMYLSDCSVVVDVLIDGQPNGYGYAGGLIGNHSNNSSAYVPILVSGCDIEYKDESPVLQYSGGLFGNFLPSAANVASDIIDCVVTCSTERAAYAGGFVGYLTSRSASRFTRCAVRGSVKGFQYVGGFVGSYIKSPANANGGLSFTDCSSSADVEAEISDYNYDAGVAGGFVGNIVRVITGSGFQFERCISSGSVVGVKHAAGFVAVTSRVFFTSCFSANPKITLVDMDIGGGIVSDFAASTPHVTKDINLIDSYALNSTDFGEG